MPVDASTLPFEPLPQFISVQFTDENGNLTAPMSMFMDQLNRTLLALISRYGWQVPTLTTDEIEYVSEKTPTGLVSDSGIPETGLPVGTIWFNTTLGKLQVKTSLTPSPFGTIETITSS